MIHNLTSSPSVMVSTILFKFSCAARFTISRSALANSLVTLSCLGGPQSCPPIPTEWRPSARYHPSQQWPVRSSPKKHIFPGIWMEGAPRSFEGSHDMLPCRRCKTAPLPLQASLIRGGTSPTSKRASKPSQPPTWLRPTPIGASHVKFHTVKSLLLPLP